MKKVPSTKKALVMSVLSLVLCFCMLAGTTYAWFTDSVTSAGNVIQAGTLDIDLYQYVGGNKIEITESSTPIFGSADSLAATADTADTLWEPGKTQTVYLSLKNNGSLNLQYKVAIEVTNVTKNMTEVVEYIITPDAVASNPIEKTVLNWNNGIKVTSGINVATEEVPLAPGAEHFFALSVHMDEAAGNEYQGGSIVFNLKVVAGQYTAEKDSFDDQYDVDAYIPAFTNGLITIPTNPAEAQSAYTTDLINEENGEKFGSATVPAAAISEEADNVSVKAVPTTQNPNITIQAGEKAQTLDVTVTGLKENNDVPVTVEYRIPTGLDPATVKLYHYETEIGCTYDPDSGLVTFQSAEFSPFTIVWEPDSTPNYAPDAGATVPKATVVENPEYVGVDLPWGSYGQWSPTAGLDSKLEAAYTFTAPHANADEAYASGYGNWECDFFVKLDTDLGENEIFLGGNYGSFGWVGFHNGDVTLKANEEIPLLGSVTSNPWTYADVCAFVSTFTCGVGDVNNALKDATFTVTLRLTNPETNETIDVSTINHKFN